MRWVSAIQSPMRNIRDANFKARWKNVKLRKIQGLEKLRKDLFIVNKLVMLYNV